MTPEEMVRVIRQDYGLKDDKVLSIMLSVPREKFVPSDLISLAYNDQALPIAHGQTISQPYTVAFMTHLLGLKGKERVLEIGTGSGYQAAILSRLASSVFTVERIRELADEAKAHLKKLRYKNVKVRAGKGEFGWREGAPFDAILVTAAIPGEIPEALISQLKDGGVLVAPIGEDSQKMLRITKKKGGLKKEEFGTFQFVPFVKSN